MTRFVNADYARRDATVCPWVRGFDSRRLQWTISFRKRRESRGARPPFEATIRWIVATAAGGWPTGRPGERSEPSPAPIPAASRDIFNLRRCLAPFLDVVWWRCLKLNPYHLILITVFASGCATLPPPQIPKPEALPDLTPFVARIQGREYLPLNHLCRRFHLAWSWEPATQVAQVMTGTAVVRLSPGLSVALVNGVPQPLGAPVLLKQGMLWVPARVAAPWVVPLPATPTAPLGIHAIRAVVLDPGHGGRDPGAIGPGGVREKEVVLDVAQRLKARLEAEGIRVLMTRSEDRFVPLSQRAAFANRHQADLFVSIHANASRARGVSGYEVYYLSEATDDAARAFAAAENAVLGLETASVAESSKTTEAIVWDLLNTENRTASRELASTVCRGLQRALPAYNRGVKSARFYVLKWTRMPAVLVEVGFVTNRAEGRRLATSSYQQEVCEGITHGLLSYKQAYERTNGFSK